MLVNSHERAGIVNWIERGPVSESSETIEAGPMKSEIQFVRMEMTASSGAATISFCR